MYGDKARTKSSSFKVSTGAEFVERRRERERQRLKNDESTTLRINGWVLVVQVIGANK